MTISRPEEWTNGNPALRPPGPGLHNAPPRSDLQKPCCKELRSPGLSAGPKLPWLPADPAPGVSVELLRGPRAEPRERALATHRMNRSGRLRQPPRAPARPTHCVDTWQWTAGVGVVAVARAQRARLHAAERIVDGEAPGTVTLTAHGLDRLAGHLDRLPIRTRHGHRPVVVEHGQVVAVAQREHDVRAQPRLRSRERLERRADCVA